MILTYRLQTIKLICSPLVAALYRYEQPYTGTYTGAVPV